MTSDASNHSSEIDIWMECERFGRVALAQVAATFVIAVTACNVPACDARIVLMVDGRRHERLVRLVHGFSEHSDEAMVLSHDSVSPF